jgi:hypothetical protein
MGMWRWWKVSRQAGARGGKEGAHGGRRDPPPKECVGGGQGTVPCLRLLYTSESRLGRLLPGSGPSNAGGCGCGWCG